MANHQRKSSRMIVLPTYVFDSVSFNSLSSPAKELLMAILAQYNRRNNGYLLATWSQYQKVLSFTSDKTFRRSLQELLNANLLAVTGTGRAERTRGQSARLFALTWLDASTTKKPLRTNWEQCPKKAEFLAKMKRQN